MAWRALLVAFVSVAALVVAQGALAGPVVQVSHNLNATGDYSGLSGNPGFDGNSIITGVISSWFQMGLIAIFGAMAWATWFVLRRERTTRGGRL